MPELLPPFHPRLHPCTSTRTANIMFTRSKDDLNPRLGCGERDARIRIRRRVCTGAAIIIRGQYYAPGQPIPEDDCKLYLLIEGPTLQVVKHAKALIKQMIEEKTEKSMRRESGAMGRYQIT
jgi:hypothetical protein